MTKKFLRWEKIYRTVGSSSYYGVGVTPSSIDIYNWKVILHGSLNIVGHGTFDGTFIKIFNRMWFLPGAQIEKILDYLFIDKETSLVQFFKSCESYNVPDCFRCKGSGRLDWISNITKVQDGIRYTREPDTILQYSVPRNECPDEGDKDNRVYPLLYISRSKLEPGEFHCRMCGGTGLSLDARYRLFSGLTKIRYRLKEFRADYVMEQLPKIITMTGGEKWNY